jgi:hypothetical protein
MQTFHLDNIGGAMVRRLVWCAAVVAAVAVWQPRSAEASPIMTLRPGATQSGAAGDTLGWGYDIVNDSDDILTFLGIGADVPSGDGTIDLGIFDFFNFQFVLLPHEALQVDYNPALGLGLVELTLSSLLAPGQTVAGRVFLDYVLTGAGGLTFGTFELMPSATVADTTPVPEPSTLLLLGTGAALLGRRRLRIARAALFARRQNHGHHGKG